MEHVAVLGGQVMAHAVWAIREGATLTPIGARQKKNGEVVTERFGVDGRAQAETQTQAFIDSGRDASTCAVVVLDALVTLGGRLVDALVMTLVSYDTPERSFKVVVPYRPHGKGFAVQRPRVVEGADDPEAQQLLELFWKGVQSNPKGARTWNEHLDEPPSAQPTSGA